MSKATSTIDLEEGPQFIAVRMAEGHPGALNVLCKIFDERDWKDYVKMLDTLDIRGRRIWVGYQYCGEDLRKFVQHLMVQDEGMLVACFEEPPAKPKFPENRRFTQ